MIKNSTSLAVIAALIGTSQGSKLKQRVVLRNIGEDNFMQTANDKMPSMDTMGKFQKQQRPAMAEDPAIAAKGQTAIHAAAESVDEAEDSIEQAREAGEAAEDDKGNEPNHTENQILKEQA